MDNGQQIRVMDFRGTYKGGGGPDKTVLNSAAQHDQSKLFVLVTYLRDPNDHEFQIALRARDLDLDYVDVFDRSLIDVRCILEVGKLVTKYRIGVIHAHDDKTSMYSYFLKLLHPRLKVLYTCHLYSVYSREEFSSLGDYLKFRIRKYARYFFLSKSDRPLLAVSDSTKEALARDGIACGEIHTVHNGIDLRKWRRAHGSPVLRRELSLGHDAVLVGTVARIAFQKDLGTFFRVAREVKNSCPQVRFVIVGDGEGAEMEKAQAEASRLGLSEYLFFTGHRNDLIDIYASLDIFLMTSISEGLPNTLLEAMAMEVPVVSTAVDGVPEVVVDGLTGYLAATGDVARLSKHLVRLVEDRQLRESCAQESRRRVEQKFCFQRRVRVMEDYYAYFAGSSLATPPGSL